MYVFMSDFMYILCMYVCMCLVLINKKGIQILFIKNK
jgi:hypothetical protein